MKTSRLFTCLLISLLAVSALTGMEFAGLTKANPSSITMIPIEHAYIRSNGDVDPPTLPIQRSENLYTLQGNLLNYSIEIQKDNIVFDGDGFALTSIFPDAPQGMTSGFPSIQILDQKNVTVRNVVFDKCYTAVSVKNSTNVMLHQNIMEMGETGIYMASCQSCSIIGNRFVDNSRTGFMILDSSHLNISYNIVSRNRSDGGWLAVNYSTISRNNITDNALSHPGIGLYLYGPNGYNDIFENNFIDNNIGLFYQGSKGISVGNKVHDNYWNNSEDAIVNVAGDAASGVDQSPHTSPLSNEYVPLYFLSTSSPTAMVESDPSFPTIVIAAIALVGVIGVGLLLYFKKRQRHTL